MGRFIGAVIGAFPGTLFFGTSAWHGPNLRRWFRVEVPSSLPETGFRGRLPSWADKVYQILYLVICDLIKGRSKLVPWLWGALQETLAQVEALAARVQALEAEA
jgi:hypothetical protein